MHSSQCRPLKPTSCRTCLQDTRWIMNFWGHLTIGTIGIQSFKSSKKNDFFSRNHFKESPFPQCLFQINDQRRACGAGPRGPRGPTGAHWGPRGPYTTSDDLRLVLSQRTLNWEFVARLNAVMCHSIDVCQWCVYDWWRTIRWPDVLWDGQTPCVSVTSGVLWGRSLWWRAYIRAFTHLCKYMLTIYSKG